MANVAFHRLTRSQFSSLSEKTNGSLYFITDENVFIMRTSDADIEYGGRVKFVAALPTGAAIKTDWLYIVGNVGSIYDSSTSSWKQVFPGAAPTDTVSNSNTTQPVTGPAVINYISGLLAANTGDENDEDKIPVLGDDGKLSSNVLPSVVISEFKGTVTSESALTALAATSENGDWAILNLSSDPDNKNGTYIYFDDGNNSTSNWIPMGSVTTEAIQALINDKVAKPTTNSNGTSGQVLTSNGNGTTSWTTLQALAWDDHQAS